MAKKQRNSSLIRKAWKGRKLGTPGIKKKVVVVAKKDNPSTEIGDPGWD